MRAFYGVPTTGRVFCLAAVFGLVIASRDAGAVLSMLLVATVAMVAVYVSVATLLSPTVIVTVEAALIGLVIGVALPEGVVLLPYLVVLALIAGTQRGVVAVTTVVLAETCTVGLLTGTVAVTPDPVGMYRALGPWLITGIIAGLMGSWLRETGRAPGGRSVDGAYESARRILGQLRSVTRNLSCGLDPVAIADELLEELRADLDADHAAVLVGSDGHRLSPLAFSSEEARDLLVQGPGEATAQRCWGEVRPIVPDSAEPEGSEASRLPVVAVPLSLGARPVGVVLARVATLPSAEALAASAGRLRERALQLETALAFDEIRSLATAEERRRLAREIHDGIAQEVASLGYLMDDLHAGATSRSQQDLAQFIRGELSRLVTELRLSIFDLRSEVNPTATLGSALSDYVRQVAARSNMAIHLTLDEGATRLRTETETELLRIAGEAIANARKHSGAENLWVTCTVQPPYTCLEISDDGRGLAAGREDSYGFHIMKERADRVNAQLDISAGPGAGTTVRVTIGEPEQMLAAIQEDKDDEPRQYRRLVGR
jgi:signal transduction histidine kinase